MISLSANVVSALSNRPTEFFYLVKITNTTGANWKLLTTHWHDLTVGGNIYLANGELVSLDPPQIGTSVDREQYKIVISDQTFSYAATVENSVVGYRAEIRLGFINYSTKVAMTTLTDTVLVYGGRVDGASYNIKTESLGNSLLQLTCASPMADLDLIRTMYCSRDYIRGRYPDDSACDQVYGGSGILQLKWGKP